MNFPTDSRKTRCDSVLDALTNEQKERLGHWLGEENRGYEEVRRLVATEFGMATSRSALSRYFRRGAATRPAGNTELGVLGLGFGVGIIDAEDLAAWGALPEETTRVIEGAVLGRARQLAFSEITMRDPDLRRVTRWMAVANKLERGQIERERMELEERRVALKERAVAAKAERAARNSEGVVKVSGGAARGDPTSLRWNSEGHGAGGEMVSTERTGVEPEHSAVQQNAGRGTGLRGRRESSSMSRLIFDRAA